MTRPEPGSLTGRPAGARRAVRALAALLQGSDDTRFLRGCLLEGPKAGSAWAAWTAGPSLADLDAEQAARLRALAPLALAATVRHGIELPPEIVRALRARRLAEARRAERYRQILVDTLRTLAGDGIHPVLLKGAALADTVYLDPLLRHCHDIDLLLGHDLLDRCSRALTDTGFDRGATDTPPLQRSWVHRSGLPLFLHATSCRVPYYRVPVHDLIEAAETRLVAGLRVRVLSPGHALLQVCTQGLAKGRGVASLWWALDAWHLAERAGPETWGVLVDCARRHTLALPLAATLAYVRDELDGRVPTEVLDALVALAAPSTSAQLPDLVPLLAYAPRGVAEFLRLPVGWRYRPAVLRSMLAPSARYLHWSGARRALASLYVRRGSRL
jgi:hypothetical protein